MPPPKYTKSIGRPASAGCARSSSHSRAEQVEVLLDLLGVLVRVDAEVAEMAALPAERDVQVQPQRHPAGAASQRREGVARDGLAGPDRKRRVVGDEIAADFGLGDRGSVRI